MMRGRGSPVVLFMVGSKELWSGKQDTLNTLLLTLIKLSDRHILLVYVGSENIELLNPITFLVCHATKLIEI